MRIGYFGGTFDPPHRGHLRVALAAADAFVLDEVLLAPTGRQPLRQTGPQAEFADRLAMVRLLAASDPRLRATDIDAPHRDGSPNYTVDALAALHHERPAAGLFAIVGADSFLSLRRWHEPGRLLTLAEWIVVARPGFDLEDMDALHLSPEQSKRVYPMTDFEDETSSSEVRARLGIGVTPERQLTPEVLLYIARMRLYHARGDRDAPATRR